MNKPDSCFKHKGINRSKFYTADQLVKFWAPVKTSIKNDEASTLTGKHNLVVEADSDEDENSEKDSAERVGDSEDMSEPDVWLVYNLWLHVLYTFIFTLLQTPSVKIVDNHFITLII